MYISIYICIYIYIYTYIHIYILICSDLARHQTSNSNAEVN